MYFITQRINPPTSGYNEPELFVSSPHDPKVVYAAFVDEDCPGELHIDDSHEFHLFEPFDDGMLRIIDADSVSRERRQYRIVGRALGLINDTDRNDAQNDTIPVNCPDDTITLRVLKSNADPVQYRNGRAFIRSITNMLADIECAYAIESDSHFTTVTIDTTKHGHNYTLELIRNLSQSSYARFAQTYTSTLIPGVARFAT